MNFRLLITFIVIWLVVPTGTPDDVITFAIIAALGLNVYLFLLGVIFIGLWYYNVKWKDVPKYTNGAKNELKKRFKL